MAFVLEDAATDGCQEFRAAILRGAALQMHILIAPGSPAHALLPPTDTWYRPDAALHTRQHHSWHSLWRTAQRGRPFIVVDTMFFLALERLQPNRHNAILWITPFADDATRAAAVWMLTQRGTCPFRLLWLQRDDLVGHPKNLLSDICMCVTPRATPATRWLGEAFTEGIADMLAAKQRNVDGTGMLAVPVVCGRVDARVLRGHRARLQATFAHWRATRRPSVACHLMQPADVSLEFVAAQQFLVIDSPAAEPPVLLAALQLGVLVLYRGPLLNEERGCHSWRSTAWRRPVACGHVPLEGEEDDGYLLHGGGVQTRRTIYRWQTLRELSTLLDELLVFHSPTTTFHGALASLFHNAEVMSVSARDTVSEAVSRCDSALVGDAPCMRTEWRDVWRRYLAATPGAGGTPGAAAKTATEEAGATEAAEAAGEAEAAEAATEEREAGETATEAAGETVGLLRVPRD